MRDKCSKTSLEAKKQTGQPHQGCHEPPEDKARAGKVDLEQVQEKLIRAERLAAVGELASGVGHELRNPLNVIRNCAYLLKMSLSEKGDEEALNTLKVLDKQIDIANKIVTDLLDFTRIRPPSLIRVDLNNLIKESLSWVTVPKDIAVTASLSIDSLQVRTDAEQISRVFANIISNAIQAMNGKGELKIESGAGDGFAWARFTDTGCGIPEENLEKIFEPLFTTRPKGIGLGLAISKRLVEQNGGRIEVSSDTARGSTFTVKLPI
jgi:signal transduction histidine kinase